MLTQSGLRLGIGLPEAFPGGQIDTAALREFAGRAEQQGYADLWLSDSIIGARPGLEPVTLLAYAAAVTDRIRLGISVLLLYQRNPIALAKALASVDQLSGGRLTVGVGLGGGTHRYPAFGLSQDRPVARFTESLQIMRALWVEERATVQGSFYQLEDTPMEPKPVQRPHPPVWFGAHAPAALRRAVRLGDGWMGAGGSRIDSFYDDLRQIRALLKESGRDESSFALSKRVYMSVDTDGDRAREQLGTALGRTYGNPNMAQAVGVAGTPAECVAALRPMRDAGLTHLLLNPLGGDPMRQLDLLTNEVAPQL